jgi:hypothetical protein
MACHIREYLGEGSEAKNEAPTMRSGRRPEPHQLCHICPDDAWFYFVMLRVAAKALIDQGAVGGDGGEAGLVGGEVLNGVG